VSSLEKIILVCGGTAGHINPALAIASEFKNRIPDLEILFIGADRLMEKRLIPEAGYELINIKMSGLKRGFKPKDIVHNLKTAINVIKASSKSNKLLKSFKPDAVIGTGGYICYPVIRKAAKMRIPAFIHEANAYPGLTVKMLSPFADKIFVTFKGLENQYKKPERIIYTGTPLRSEFYETKENVSIKPDDKPLVVSFWGSLGAQRMNDMMVEFIKKNAEIKGFCHIHATGNDTTQMINQLKDIGVEQIDEKVTDIREYISDMPSVMREAELVLCRAGASTIAELAALGKPAILVPSPYVADNHQEENARKLHEAGGALMIRESECTGVSLYETVSSLLKDSDRLNRMSISQKSLSAQNAASKIVDIIIQYCRKDA
jgi:UDP-N-acetylglucosamine--N-acetylmuramyl-(pentapeptide) pyrophosphoryl-undecaprenol N-acetylglucosamine transferase